MFEKESGISDRVAFNGKTNNWIVLKVYGRNSDKRTKFIQFHFFLKTLKSLRIKQITTGLSALLYNFMIKVPFMWILLKNYEHRM